MHWYRFLDTVEKIIYDNVKANYPRDWDEDFITRSLLKSLRQTFGPRTLICLDRLDYYLSRYPHIPLPFWWRGMTDEIRVEWDAYKMTGANESKFGDVAILVSAKYPDGDKVDGVAFLEAKKRYKSSHNFQAINFDQLARINSHAPRASVLLYDFVPVCRYWNGLCTFAVTVPMDLVILTKKKDTSLYKFATPFSFRLIAHLLGYCLERADEPLKIARGYQTEYGTPLYLLVVRVGIGVEPPSGDEVEFNRDRFARLEE